MSDCRFGVSPVNYPDPDNLRNVTTYEEERGTSPAKHGKLIISKSKSSRLSSSLDETNPFEIDKCKSKNGASVSEVLALFNNSSGG